jgi:fructose 1,6-bisphosphatase
MKLTISAFGAEIGSIAGLAPSARLLAVIHATLHPAKFRRQEGPPLLIDYHVSYAGNAVTVLLSHSLGTNSPDIQKLAWATLLEAAKTALEQGLCGAGKCLEQTLPPIAELEFEERPGEAFLLFAADHVLPKTFILPLDRGDTNDRDPVLAAAGPVMLVRTQMEFLPSTHVLAAFAAGATPVLPVPLNTPRTYSDGLPLVSCAAFSVHRGKLTEPVDCFANPFWNTVRDQAAQAARAHSAEFLVARTLVARAVETL